MIKNKALDFIIEKIQWGEAKANSAFYSEKELAIKLNISASTAKNALNFAESIHLLKSTRGRRRVVLDFTKNVFLTRYLAIDYHQIKLGRETKLNAADQLIFKRHFHHQIRHAFKLNIFKQDKIIASFYSSTPIKSLYESFLGGGDSFLDFLKLNKIIINQIERTTFYENNKIFIKRYLFGDRGKLIEEGLLIVAPEYFYQNTKTNFFYSYKLE